MWEGLTEGPLFGHRSHFTVGWIVIVAQFLILEAIAIFHPTDGATFSNHVRGFLVHQPEWTKWFTVLFLAWLAYHFVEGLGK